MKTKKKLCKEDKIYYAVSGGIKYRRILEKSVCSAMLSMNWKKEHFF